MEHAPITTIDDLIAAGFVRQGVWKLEHIDDEPRIELDFACSPQPGVYAFVIDGCAHYIGSAQRGLRARLRRYSISKTMRTSQRVRGEILGAIAAEKTVDVYTIALPSLRWNGLPVDLIAGLEEGLIRTMRPKWNKRSNRD